MDANGSRMQFKSLDSIMSCVSSHFFESFTVVGLLLVAGSVIANVVAEREFHSNHGKT